MLNKRLCSPTALAATGLVIAIVLIGQPVVLSNPGYNLVAMVYGNNLVSTTSVSWVYLMGTPYISVPGTGTAIATFSVEATLLSSGGSIYVLAILCGPSGCYVMRPNVQVAIVDSLSSTCPSCFRTSSFTFYYSIPSSGAYKVVMWWRAGSSGDSGAVIARTLIFLAHQD